MGNRQKWSVSDRGADEGGGSHPPKLSLHNRSICMLMSK